MKCQLGFGLVVLLIGMLLIGCSDDSPADPAEVDLCTIIPPPDEQSLMGNFRISMEAMSPVVFSNLFHDDFRFVILQATIDDWENSSNPLSETFFDGDQMLEMHQKIFEGIEGCNEMGVVVTPVESISISVMDKEESWQPIGEGVEYFSDFHDAYRARYNCLFHFHRAGGFRFEVDEAMDFIVVPVTICDNTGWQILGLIPHAEKSSRATETVKYGGLLSLYRSCSESR